jgi:RNA polymerase sigma factor (sigma-70 family)
LEQRPAAPAIATAAAQAERKALAQKVCAEHRAPIVALVARRGKLPVDKAEDVAQRVLLLLGEEVEESGPPTNLAAFVSCTIRFELRNHRRVESRAPRPWAEVDVVPASQPTPERVAELREQRRKVQRYLPKLKKALADAVHCMDILGMTLEEAAEELGCPPPTVASRRARGVEALKKLARKSAEETDRGLRRRPRR